MRLTEDTINTVTIKIPDTTIENDILRYEMIDPNFDPKKKITKLEILEKYYIELRSQYGEGFLTRIQVINKIRDKLSITSNTASVYYYRLKNNGINV